MQIYSTVEKAVQLVIDNLEANHMVSDSNSIRQRVYSWYNHSDVTDPQILAACALEGKDWFPGATYKDMLIAKEMWFPQDTYNNISIWEIEAAQYDMFWR